MIIKRIMSEETIISSLKNQDWKTVKVETEKINKSSTHISMNNITELSELIYAGVKLVCEKNQGSPKKHTKKFKT